MDIEYKRLVLPLIVVVYTMYCPVTEASVVNTASTVRVWPWQDIQLPCHFEDEPFAVFWVRESTSHQQLDMIKASFFGGNFASKEERFNINKNFSLVINDLQVADGGRYHCQLVLETFEVFLNSTLLTVRSPTVDTAPTVHGWKGEDIRLPCDFKEEPLAVYWVKESMLQPELSTSKAFYDGNFVSMEARFDIDRNFGLLITDLKVADEGLYYCQLVLLDFEVFENSTLMTVSSVASKHAIEECVDDSQPNPSRCTYHTPSETSSFDLTCVVSGFKPNVTMLWTEESGRTLYSMISKQTTLSDDTYERFEIINVSARHGTRQTFKCTATGDSLDGTSTAEITVLPIPVPGKRSNVALIVGPVIGVLVALAIIVVLLGRRFLRKADSYLQKERDELRRKITDYVPGKAANYYIANPPSKVNIIFFGEIAAGKSCLINSLNFALNGEYPILAEEGYAKHIGGRTHHILTDRIDLIETRGITDFSSETLQRPEDELHGIFPVNGETRVKRKDEECHCAVFVYHYRPDTGEEAISFIEDFCRMVCYQRGVYPYFRYSRYYRADLAFPIIFVTHKNEYPNVWAVRQVIYRFFQSWYSKPTIQMFENYTKSNNEEDVEKDIEYLELIWSALEMCDWTLRRYR